MVEDGLDLPPETREILSGLSAFLDREVTSRHRELADLLDNPRRRYTEAGRHVEEVEDLRRAVRAASSAAGYYQMLVPEELGGGGQGAVTMYAAWELIHHQCGSQQWLAHEAIAHWATGPSHVFQQASPEVRQEILPNLLSGQDSMCFMMSEPGAGSDVWEMTTRAVPDNDRWRITGTKQWISNGPHAQYGLVFAVTDPERLASRSGGISAFLVETDAPGFHVDSVIRLYGHIGGNHGILSLDNVVVDGSRLVGELHEGLQVGLDGISLGRMYNAARAVGLARWSLEKALDFAKERETFGQPLIRNQGIAFPLAECAMQIHAAHLMGLHAARMLERGDRALKEAAMAKAYSTEMATRVIDRAIQTHGGMGITGELGLTDAWELMRTVQIADGSAEILRRLIARRLEGGDLRL